MTTHPIWWEKTVEYAFVLSADREMNLKFASPLSGLQEKIGDGVFSIDSRIILVEFKRSRFDFNSEREKFEDYDGAHKALSSRDAHHFIIYGSSAIPPGCSEPQFRLHARTYFSARNTEPALAVLKKGIEPKNFNLYLEELLELKRTDGRASGTVGLDSVSSVFGVSEKNSSCSSISLAQYVSSQIPHLHPHHVQTSGPSGPRPPGG